jgi:uncharacterized protein (DUF486 family)
MLLVPRFGRSGGTRYPLLLDAGVVTLVVLMVFAVAFLKERLAWNYVVAFAFLGVAAFFAFAFKAPGPAV